MSEFCVRLSTSFKRSTSPSRFSFTFIVYSIFTRSCFSLYSIYSTAPSLAWSEVDRDALLGSIALLGRLEVSVRDRAPCVLGIGFVGGGICPTFRAWSQSAPESPVPHRQARRKRPEKVCNYALPVRGSRRNIDIQ